MTDETRVPAAADDAELAVMSTITGAMKTPMTDAQRQLVVDWFETKYGGHVPAPSTAAAAGSIPDAGDKRATPKRKAKAKPRAAASAAGTTPAKTKGPARPDKDLDLNPAGKTSFRDFVAEKRPADNAYEHNVVALYWLTQVAEVEKATADMVYSCYREAKWKLPADLRNSLQVTASHKSWMHTNEADNLRITSPGINFVERDLPRPGKA